MYFLTYVEKFASLHCYNYEKKPDGYTVTA